MTADRPTALPVRIDGIHDALKAECRWVVWKYEWRDTRWAKMQYRVSGSGGAKSNDPSTWRSFADAIVALNNFDGISFALGDGWAGLDADHFKANPAWEHRFRALGAYCERSPGGEGIKIVGRSSRIGGELNFANGEPTRTAWVSGRFFTITGQESFGDPTTDISTLINEQFPVADKPPATRDGYRDAALTSDDDLLMQMIGADNGDQVLALWRGDTSRYGDDHSRADQALCCHLAFWTNYDLDRIDRLFRQSGLMRPKWNGSYQRATLAKALR
jgi:putative DNA primase/helicase